MSERLLAVITGASSGIGAAFARKLAARGYDLLLISRREERLRSLAGEIAGLYHVAARPMAADLTSDADCERVAETVRGANNLGLLVNNAGFGSLGYFWATDIAGQDRMHRLHVLATLRLTHAALVNLLPKRSGGIINVSSLAAFGQTPQSVSYSATKSWMNSFTEGLALELAANDSPVKVQALCPGFTLTEFHDTLGMERGPIPRPLWMTADFVVEQSLRSFDRGKLFVVPGWRYKLLLGLIKVLPASLMRQASVAGVRRFRKRRDK